MEKFSTCWEDKDMPYLQPLADTPGHADGHCFCDTQDKEILSQVLNNYDQETVDFYRWSIEYDRDSLSELVARRSGVDVGRIKALEPLERGESGRIYKLRIVGEDRTITVGKELEIRRILSESHLKSSAFEPVCLDASGKEVEPDSEWVTLRLDGRGWGHGVGLCQIGAAVMAAEGYSYKEILSHYYPGTEL
jgi:SpoIID/LytB domain protein